MKAALFGVVSATLVAGMIKALTRSISRAEEECAILVDCPQPCQQQQVQQQQEHQQQQRQFTAHLLSDTNTTEQALLSLTDVHVIGLDCEWQPERGKQHNPIALLQLAAGGEHGCLLVQLQHMQGLPAQLLYMLQDPLVIKV